MRISELSKQTGVPVATIKFYLREGLLPPGTPSGRNQADYGPQHLRRIRFIRALTSIGRMDLSSVRRLLRIVEEEQQWTLPDLYAMAYSTAWPLDLEPLDTPLTDRARADVAGFLADLGWQVGPETPGYSQFLTVLVTLRRLGCGCEIDYFTSYAEAAERLMTQELALLPPEVRGTERAAAIARTILMSVGMTALSSMAQAHLLAQRPTVPPPRPGAA